MLYRFIFSYAVFKEQISDIEWSLKTEQLDKMQRIDLGYYTQSAIRGAIRRQAPLSLA
jgi:hypothetical protein